MPISDSDLYHWLQSFPIDEGSPVLSFEARLARENGWDAAFARRVVFEYRRFLFLAMTTDHVVSPSESVDQAWHLHLTYTRSYWERMCGEVLGRPLHHGPTRGGSDESKKFRDLYAATLTSYQLAFGEEPPADIWPAADARFGEDMHFVRVNTARNWVVPKVPLRRGLRAFGFGFGVVACATGCGGVVANPFDLAGTDFLWFLVPLLLTALVVGLWLRNFLRGSTVHPGDDEPELDWADVAYLAGGRHRLTTAAIARLVAAGVARVSADGTEMEVVAPLPSGLSEIEREVFAALPLARDDPERMRRVARWVDRAFAARVAELWAAGYVLSNGRMVASAIVAVLPLLAVIGLGVSRVVRGVEAGKPSGLLMFTLLVAVVTGLFVFRASMNRSARRGALALTRLRAATSPPPVDATPGSVGQLVGLYGTSALTGCALVDLAAVATWYPRPTPGSGDSGGGCGTGCGASAGSDGGSGCGGGGCGGGGCGGGCGGCGG